MEVGTSGRDWRSGLWRAKRGEAVKRVTFNEIYIPSLQRSPVDRWIAEASRERNDGEMWHGDWSHREVRKGLCAST